MANAQLQWKPRLRIGEIDVTPYTVGTWNVHSGLSATEATVTSRMEFDLRADAEVLPKLNLRLEVVCEVVTPTDEVASRTFMGVVVVAEQRNDLYHIVCEDPSRILKSTRLGQTYLGPGLSIAEQIYTVLKLAMPNSVGASTFQPGTEAEIGSERWRFSQREFRAVVPILTLELPQDRLELFGYSVVAATAKDDEIVQDLVRLFQNDRATPEFLKRGSLLVFNLEASDFVEAHAHAAIRASDFIDRFDFASRLATPAYADGPTIRTIPFDQSRSKSFHNPEGAAFIFDLSTPARDRVYFGSDQPHLHRDSIHIVPDGPVAMVASDLIGPQVDLPVHVRQALHDLRRAREAKNPRDGLNAVWQTIEQLCSSQTVPKLFTQAELRALQAATSSVPLEDARDRSAQKKAARLRDLIAKLDEPPLKARWESFLDHVGTPLSQADRDAIWSLRSKRNHDSHGRQAAVSLGEVARATDALEKVIIAALASERAHHGV